jgi:hypothetical protein
MREKLSIYLLVEIDPAQHDSPAVDALISELQSVIPPVKEIKRVFHDGCGHIVTVDSFTQVPGFRKTDKDI